MEFPFNRGQLLNVACVMADSGPPVEVINGLAEIAVIRFSHSSAKLWYLECPLLKRIDRL